MKNFHVLESKTLIFLTAQIHKNKLVFEKKTPVVHDFQPVSQQPSNILEQISNFQLIEKIFTKNCLKTNFSHLCS